MIGSRQEKEEASKQKLKEQLSYTNKKIMITQIQTVMMIIIKINQILFQISALA